MSKIEYIKKVLKKPKYLLLIIDKLGIYHIDDEKYIKLHYEFSLNKKLNLNNPQLYNEKMQWLKLNDRNPKYSMMADKYEAKKYVSSIIGDEYIIPTYGIYDKFEDIDFSELPNEFVIKCTHDSSGPIIVHDKSQINYKKIKKTINKHMKKNYFYSRREWPYKNIKPRIIIEKFIKDDMMDDLRDYKFMCFNGKPKFVYITVKNDSIFENYYDLDFKPVDINHNFPKSDLEFKKPDNFDKMIEIAKKLSRNIPFSRIDLHNVSGKIFFGEVTFYDWAGYRAYHDDETDLKLGKYVKLN